MISPSNFEAFRERNYFPALDGLRGISILLVLIHHVPALHATLPAGLAHNGRYGVSFFFVISGFLICSLLLRERRTTGRISLPKFYGRRALRLLPLYYTILAVQAVLVLALNHYSPENQQLFRDKLPSYLFYFSNWLPTSTEGPFFCAWSLAVEEQFYLGFGLLLFLARPGFVAWIVTTGLLVKFGAYFVFGQVDTVSTSLRILFSYEEPILWGVLLGFALEDRRAYRLLAGLLGRASVLIAISLVLVVWLVTHPMETSSTWDAEVLYILMTAIVAAVAVRAPVGFLGGGLLAHVGRVSYGVYLLHMFFISAVRKLPYGSNGAVCFVASAVLSIGAATLVYRYFELPIIQFYKKRLSPHRAAPADAANLGGTAVTQPKPV
jgi:peptidoglycan/LPS O-acetylase OafA/YrhL